eukprot:5479337-Amphidinium_carterae.1
MDCERVALCGRQALRVRLRLAAVCMGLWQAVPLERKRDACEAPVWAVVRKLTRRAGSKVHQSHRCKQVAGHWVCYKCGAQAKVSNGRARYLASECAGTPSAFGRVVLGRAERGQAPVWDKRAQPSKKRKHKRAW